MLVTFGPTAFFSGTHGRHFWARDRGKWIPFGRELRPKVPPVGRVFRVSGSYLNTYPNSKRISFSESSWSETLENLKNFSYWTLLVSLLFFSGTHGRHFWAQHRRQVGQFGRELRPKVPLVGPWKKISETKSVRNQKSLNFPKVSDRGDSIIEIRFELG